MTHHEHPNVTLVREGFAAFERATWPEWISS